MFSTQVPPTPRRLFSLGALVLSLLALGCATNRVTGPTTWTPPAGTDAFLDDLERRTVAWFTETTDPNTGLTPDRAPQPPFCSIAAVGFALTAYPVGVERDFPDLRREVRFNDDSPFPRLTLDGPERMADHRLDRRRLTVHRQRPGKFEELGDDAVQPVYLPDHRLGGLAVALAPASVLAPAIWIWVRVRET